MSVDAWQGDGPPPDSPGGLEDDLGVEVLLVEDDAAIRDMYRIRLTLDGYRVVTAEDGEDGLAKARELRPDIIFLDVRLPRRDGFEVLAELRTDPDTASIPVIILSNYGERELIERGLSLGARDYLVKARVTPDVVAEAIDEWIGR